MSEVDIESTGISESLPVAETFTFERAGMRARLDACLLTDEEMAHGPTTWRTWHNPFPDWS